MVRESQECSRTSVALLVPHRCRTCNAPSSRVTVNVQVGLGGLYRPTSHAGALEVDARGDAQVLSVEGQVLFGLGAPSGVMVAVEALPHLFVEPTARIDWYGGTPGGALGVAFRPAPFVRLAVEANYEDATPGVWVAADVFTPSTSRRSGDGGDPLRTR
jgi:hypothetical protein